MLDEWPWRRGSVLFRDCCRMCSAKLILFSDFTIHGTAPCSGIYSVFAKYDSLQLQLKFEL